MKTEDSAELGLPSLADAEAVVGSPAQEWVARCYEIAYALVEAGLVPGRAAYGHYLGPVKPGTFFFGRARSCGFIGHGWVALPDGRVFDPTRWVFEGREPYLYVGEPGEPLDPIAADLLFCLCGHTRGEHSYGGFFNHCQSCADGDCLDFNEDPYDNQRLPLEYDEGGNQWREQTLSPPPAFDPAADTVELDLDEAGSAHVCGLLGGSPKVTVEQCLWLANLPLRALGDQAPAVFRAIEQAGHAGFLPIDNRLKVLGGKL